MQQPVAATDGGTLLRVDVTPDADENVFPDGFNPWRELVEARVTAPARQGEANHALCQLAARVLGLDAGDVAVKSGKRARRKTLLIQGLSPEQVNDRLDGVIET